MHRYDFDGRYAYISPTAEGYVGNIVMILDLADPAKPEEVGRWWIPGQWQAGGEHYPWDDCVPPRCHHPLRLGDRLYVSYWHHGFFILDIADMSRPKACRGAEHQPGFPASDPHLPAHAGEAEGPRQSWSWRTRTWRSSGRRRRPSPGSTTSPTRRMPLPIATFQVPGLDKDGAPQPPMTGCHQPSERFHGTVIPFAWFAQGLAARRHRRSVRAARGRSLLPDAPRRARSGLVQRRDDRRPRA